MQTMEYQQISQLSSHLNNAIGGIGTHNIYSKYMIERNYDEKLISKFEDISDIIQRVRHNHPYLSEI